LGWSKKANREFFNENANANIEKADKMWDKMAKQN